VPVSKRTGRRYAAGSQKKWAGWEPRVCWRCGTLVVLDGPGMHSSPVGGRPFSLCGAHLSSYGDAWREAVA
jgi:hypothetical protein